MSNLETKQRQDEYAVDQASSQKRTVRLWSALVVLVIRRSRRSLRFRLISVLSLVIGLFVLLLVLRPLVFSAAMPQQQDGSSDATIPPIVQLTTDPLVTISQDGSMLYALAPDGSLQSWSFTTKSVTWQTKITVLSKHRLLAGEHIVYTFSWNSQRAVLEAWQVGDGRRLWERAYPSPGLDPLMLEGKYLYINVLDGVVLALDAKSGTQLWSFRTERKQPLKEILWADGKIAAVLSKDGMVKVLKARDGSLVCQYRNEYNDLSTPPLLASEMLYVRTANKIQAISISNGTLIWQYEREGPERLLLPIVHNGIVYVSEADGRVKALRGMDGVPIWEKKLQGLLSKPMIQGQDVYLHPNLYLVQTDGSLYVLNTHDGMPRWNTEPGKVRGALSVTDHTLFLNYDIAGQEIHALSTYDGHELWKRVITTPQAYYQPPVITNELLLFRSTSYALDAWSNQDGEQLWHYSASTSLNWPPLVKDELVYITHQDGSVNTVRTLGGDIVSFYGHRGEVVRLNP